MIFGFDMFEFVECSDELNLFYCMCEILCMMLKVMIVKIVGWVGGGGSELVLLCDMCFGVIGKMVIN